MKSIGFKFWRIGIFLFMRNVWKYKHFVLLPTLALDAVKGYDRYADLKLKFLCFGLGFRFIWITKRYSSRKNVM